MPSQGKQDQSNNCAMEDSTMTIEFLRARLLSERSVSKSARARADELAQRVAELEEQLRIVSVQRMKAEKATVNVLAILESNGLSDASGPFDSSSDQDDESEFGLVNGSSKEVQSSVNSKAKNSESDERSGSDEFIPSTARSLSWKSGKDGTGSMKRCKDPALRSSNTFTSASSSSRRQPGKSCRQTRRKDTRAGDMEKAIEQQAQLIERYEEMEKAQREWEEKFRETSSSAPDSCDPGNRSDVTEEAPYEINEHPPHAARTIVSTNHVEKSEAGDFPKFHPNGSLQQTVNKEHLKVQKNSIAPTSGSRCHDFACSSIESKHNEAQLANIRSSPSSSSHEHQQTHGTNDAPGSQLNLDFESNRASDINKERASQSQSEVHALVPHKAPKELGILEALKKAKQSLQQQIDNIPSAVSSSPVGTSYALSSLRTTAPVDNTPEIPGRYPGLFRLPTDFPAPGRSEGNKFSSLNTRLSLDSELLGPSRADILSSSARSSFENHHSGKESNNPEAAVSNQLVAMPQYSDPKMNFPTDNHLLTSKQYGASIQRQRIDPSIDMGLPSSIYPAFPVSPVYGDLMFRMPPSEGFSTFPGSRAADGILTSPTAGPGYGDLMLRMTPSEGFSTIPSGRRTTDGIPPSADRFSFSSPYSPDMYR
ncbi:unnamed protein product [Linum tenue]|uniref:Uncharacterized protein n=1 Tax=Linum tenue TaxID=586396 RepID=A0AAV0JMS6_9ROSI|nr:unnamed protein product [Linum tenue]